MDSILIILKKKMAQGFICPYTGTIFYNIRIYSRCQVSVYRTIGPLVTLSVSFKNETLTASAFHNHTGKRKRTG